MTGLDTNVLLRYLVRDEPTQTARATRELERDERFLIGSVVLCELLTAASTDQRSLDHGHVLRLLMPKSRKWEHGQELRSVTT